MGTRVVDSGDERGELCGRLLADLGADVVRVEPPGGTPSRRLPPFAPGGTSLRFAVRNTNKRSVTLDLGTDEGRSGLDRLPEAEAFRIDSRLVAAVFMSDDAKEGPRAFTEKRTPTFLGRRSRRWCSPLSP